MAVKMPLGLRIAIIDRAFRRKMDEWAEEIGITAVQLRVLGEVSLMEDSGRSKSEGLRTYRAGDTSDNDGNYKKA